ncbi:MAG: VWA domain-containing protein [Brucellaceae bacterium]|nr:VWA domain-containing protein [Brucellaceae bacterium]
MKQRLMAGSALATLMILPVAGYVSWQLSQDMQLGQTGAPAPSQATSSDGAAQMPAPESRMVEQKRELTDEIGGVVAKQAVEPLSAAPPPAEAEFAADVARGRALVAPSAESPVVVLPEPMPVIEGGRDRVEEFDTNPVKAVAEAPVSTFSADVDTASYSMVRRALKQGILPDPGSVRVEELVNYFPYAYPGPDSAETPFKATVTVTPTPWNANTKLLHIGVKGYDVTPAERPRANLVFLIDVSGSMNEADKLPLLKSAFRLLVDRLQPDDTVSIVTYAGEAGTVLEPTKASEKAKILDAMQRLQPGGSTAGAAGLEEAYRLAEQGFVKDGVNRVMLATDGDFNVGPSNDEALKTMIEKKRESGVFLSVFGFGQGNYNDQLMQTIAQNGNGVAAYIDTLSEAEKTLVQEASSSLFPIASDVKFQIEFNPAVIAEYRQIGFETRALNREDFNNDRVDAGEIGSGHTVTAIYEITPVGSPAVLVNDLRYGEKTDTAEAGASDEIAFLKMRAKVPGEATSKLTEIPVTTANEIADFATASDDVRFSIAVAAFGQKLRKTDQLATYGYDAIEQVAAGARGADPYGYRSEFLQLVRLADSLDK